MTKQEILKMYDSKDGYITSPGKFESEPLYVVYFWDFAMCCGEDETIYNEDDTITSKFIVTDDDRKHFPELKDVKEVFLSEDSQGFVNRYEN